MKDLLAAVLVAGVIVAAHFVAYAISLVPWLSLLLLAWLLGAIVIALLSAIGVTTIDLSNVRSKSQNKRY